MAEEKTGAYPPPADPGYPPANPGYPPAADPAYPPAATSAPGPPPPAYQQQPGPPPPQQTTTTVIVQQPAVKWTDAPANVRCPNCNNDVLTNTSHSNGAMVWIAMGILLFFGFWMGCFLIPLCIPALKDVDHTCPVCNYRLGKYERLKL